jgi:hypothetical protein
MNSLLSEQSVSKVLMIGGSVIMAVWLLYDFKALPPISLGPPKVVSQACRTIVQPDARLSNQQVAQLLVLAEGSKKQQTQQMLGKPYCQLADLQVRVGATSKRDAYPLVADPLTRLIVLYEGDEYAGYRFDVNSSP